MTEETLWQTVLAGDARADGTFVYAVRSTGIYCRPSCPARRPRREVVAFFASPAEAERAGFRACRRCRPRERTAPDRQVDLVRRVCRSIDAGPEAATTLDVLAGQVGLSPAHLQKVFK